jgi:hypothetical protein
MIPNWFTEGREPCMTWPEYLAQMDGGISGDHLRAPLCLCNACTALRKAAFENGSPGPEEIAARVTAAKQQADRLVLEEYERRVRGQQLFKHGEPSAQPRGFFCHGCGFRFAARPLADTACQYCGAALLALQPPAVTAGPEIPPGPEEKPGKARPRQDLDAPAGPETAEAWTTGLRRELLSPLGLPEHVLPSYGATPPGCCRDCHLECDPRRSRCWYCDRLRDLGALRPEAPDPEPLVRIVLRSASTRFLIAGVVLFWALMTLLLMGAL